MVMESAWRSHASKHMITYTSAKDKEIFASLTIIYLS